MCLSSRICKFIQTQTPEKRDSLIKLHLENMREDESIFHPNIIDYYQNRLDSLEENKSCIFCCLLLILKGKVLLDWYY